MRIKNIISHRGNIDGPNKSLENTQEYIKEAAKKYRVEIDVWYQDNKFFLGHDSPGEEVDKLFLMSDAFLVHCKNFEAFVELRKFSMTEAFFQHEDDVALTTKNRIIFHSKITPKELSQDDYQVFLGPSDGSFNGICSVVTDYPSTYNCIDTTKEVFDLLIIDIDGVMTNGKKIYKNDASVLAKEYADKDFTAIKRFKNAGVNVCFLSGDKTINENMAKNRGIDFYYARLPDGNIDKSVFLKNLKEKYKSNAVAYVGDDYYDITLIETVDYSFCPSDACQDIKDISKYVLKTKSGDGVIAEIFDIFKDNLDKSYAIDNYKC